MDELIKIEVNSNNEQAVLARDLHSKLGILKDFSDWFKMQVERLNLQEGRDFTPFWGSKTEGRGGHNKIEYVVPIDIAKHICMISGGEKAYAIREYFIQVERAWNSPEQVMARALQIANKRIGGYIQTIQELAPAAEFGNAVSGCQDSILIRDFAKLLANAGITIGQDRLFSWLNIKGYIFRDRSSGDWRPKQVYVDQGLFRVKESRISTNSRGECLRFTTKITGKGQRYFFDKLKYSEYNYQ
jgi:anti-repressor protein